MRVSTYFKELIQKQKAGAEQGICSICSSNTRVIEAAMDFYKGLNKPILIEATANQVNQYGGYTGMRPAAFRDLVYQIADRMGFDRAQIILGGDHLGPLVWNTLPEREAMEKATALIREYVQAGFEKIHLDTSMRLGDDDPTLPLDLEKIARRSAVLCAEAERGEPKPVYVIGSEVPIPGGALENEKELAVTSVSDLDETIWCYRKHFLSFGLSDAYERIIGVVVQPGVEFSDDHVFLYDAEKALLLSNHMRKVPNLVLEGHSTDYQPREMLQQMRKDGVAILKVGPALTYALREGLFALEFMEREINGDSFENYSDFQCVLDNAMTSNPLYWKKHLHGNDREIEMERRYSLADRWRYYYTDESVQRSIDRLLNNLGNHHLPYGLLRQFMPVQFDRVLQGTLSNDARSLLKDKVQDVLRTYE